ncbi:MAG: 50S ribosomal protein L11 methyltransferase [Gaiellaceae bacterium]
MLELVPGGFEEVEGSGWVELAAYTDGAGEMRIRATFDDVSTRSVDRGWAYRWREFHRPVRVGGLWICPPWEPAPRDENVVVVDPGRAFGTGAHATTRMCIELLAGLERGSLLDAGCGSGVIAVAAVRLGFGPVFAADVDPIAVGVARETAGRNGVSIEVREADVMRDDLRPVDVLVANIELAVVEVLLARRPALARTIVTSGYLAGERPQAKRWAIVRGVELDGWAAQVWFANDVPD